MTLVYKHLDMLYSCFLLPTFCRDCQRLAKELRAICFCHHLSGLLRCTRPGHLFTLSEISSLLFTNASACCYGQMIVLMCRQEPQGLFSCLSVCLPVSVCCLFVMLFVLSNDVSFLSQRHPSIYPIRPSLVCFALEYIHVPCSKNRCIDLFVFLVTDFCGNNI